MKTIMFLLTLFACSAQPLCAATDDNLELKSPDGTVAVNVSLSNGIVYDVTVDGTTVLDDCRLGMKIGKYNLGTNPKLKKVERGTIDERIRREVPIKNAVVDNCCNTMTLVMEGDYSVEFRAFDNGVAYRFVTSMRGSVDVENETFDLHFPSDFLAHVSHTSSFKTSYETTYRHQRLSEIKPDGDMTYLPVLVETGDRYKILISESDLRDYPCMFLRGTGGKALTATFPKVPLETGPDGDRSQKIIREASYIARTSGRRSFPWRYFVISKSDRDLVANEMTYVLSSPCEIADPSWIRPGQVSWDWWNHRMVWNVDFKAGINTATYKCYIDFASTFGIPYIIMDEGWAKSTTDPFTPCKDIDLKELISYGNSKNVGIILWLPWLTVENHPDLFARYAEWGVPGVKIDFMDRSDQWMVNYYERVVKEAARHHILVDFHGSFKPAGLERRYPNLLSYEGVCGLEQNQGCQPVNSIYLPFMRNAVGPMDFTPGAMNSVQPEWNHSTDPSPMGNGTRAYQMALYVVFESGIQMLSDSPTRYYAERPCTEFIASVPVTWDETRVLDAKVGEYVVVARRRGEKWFVGAITNDKARTLDISFSFFQSGARRLTCFEDGVNAGRQAMDYRRRVQTVDNNTTLRISLERNGGWCGVIEKNW